MIRILNNSQGRIPIHLMPSVPPTMSYNGKLVRTRTILIATLAAYSYLSCAYTFAILAIHVFLNSRELFLSNATGAA